MNGPTAVDGWSKSRQKNCHGCIQAKRRCDRRMPTCSRCVEKKLDCIYGKASKAAGWLHRDGFAPLFPAVGRATSASLACSAFIPGPLDANYFGVTTTATTTTAATDTDYMIHDSIDGDMSIGPFIDMMANASIPTQDPTQDLSHVQPAQGPMVERPTSPADEEITGAYDKMDELCKNTDPWALYDSKTPLYYVVNRVKAFTADAATRNATPFMHRYLYRDHTPRCIISCFTGCVLYANRTRENTPMVMRALHGSVRELLDAESGRVVVTPVEKLARTQSLFLYQIIRLLDGDVTLRAQGEKDMPLLQRWLGELCKIRDNLGDLAQLGDGVMREDPPKDWERWIFAESMRRTIVMAYSFVTLYSSMKSPEAGVEPDYTWGYAHRWTLSRHLWEADSSFEFSRIWRDKPHFIVTNYSFGHFLDCGRGEDVDEFAEVLLSVYMGVDEAKEFISAEKSSR